MDGRIAKRVRDEDLADYKEWFDYFDKDDSGLIEKDELDLLLQKLNIHIAPYKIKNLKRDYGDTIDFEEFQDIVAAHSTAQSGAAFRDVLSKRKVEHITGGTSHGSAEGTTHSFSKSEAVAFVDWMNIQLANNEDLKLHGYIPLNIEADNEALFKKLKNGVLLCKLINATVPDTIDDRVINMKPVSTYAIHENQTLAINSAISIGCRVVNIGAEDLATGKPHLMLGLLWQVIRIGLFSHVTLSEVPGLRRLIPNITTEEKDEKLRQMSPEEILILWVNYHLALAESPRRLANFSDDIKDSEIYSVLLTRLASLSELSVNETSLIPDSGKKAVEVLKNAETMGCRRFIKAKDILDGNEKLNLAFVANLFNTYPCLPEEGENDLQQQSDNSQVETREEKMYRNWMNSLGVSPFVSWIYADLQDGHILFQLYDQIHADVVDWSRVASKKNCSRKGGHLEKIANCNYAVEIGNNEPFKFRLVNIQGQDIKEGKKNMTLSLLKQMMEAYTLSILTQLDPSGGQKKSNEGDIFEWLNNDKDGKLKGSENAIYSFGDPNISTSLAVIELIDRIKKKTVDYRLVIQCDRHSTYGEKMQNARYALSMARKIGAQIYALPEHLVEVNPKMVMTVFACLMVCETKHN